MPILLGLAIALTAGLLMTRIMRLLNLPNVTGYLIAGLIIGPFCAKLLSIEIIDALGAITTVALG
ncbi:MAG: cation:proton antiporter, partial [Clostridiales bacterium]|nr:cation:proton antiporter [Clostridiales bacterium]